MQDNLTDPRNKWIQMAGQILELALARQDAIEDLARFGFEEPSSLPAALTRVLSHDEMLKDTLKAMTDVETASRLGSVAIVGEPAPATRILVALLVPCALTPRILDHRDDAGNFCSLAGGRDYAAILAARMALQGEGPLHRHVLFGHGTCLADRHVRLKDSSLALVLGLPQDPASGVFKRWFSLP